MRGAQEGTFIRDERVLWRRVFDGVLLCLPDSGELVTVTGPGADLWELLDEPQSIQSITQQLADRYPIAAQEVESGLRPLLADLARRSAIKTVPGRPDCGAALDQLQRPTERS